MPEISIVVPVYNAEKYISKCIDSLLNQTFSDIEIICVDDGSSDGTPAILDSYARQDPRVIVIHQTNTGIGGARNRGIAEASGKYMMFCDNDDWYEPNMCEILRSTLLEKQVDMVMCNPFFELEDKKLPRISLSTVGTIPGGLYRGVNRFFPTTSGLVWNKIFKTELIRKYDMKFGPGRGEDLVFGREYMFVIKSFFSLNRNLYHYRIRSTSTSKGTADPIQLSLIQDFQITYDFLKKHDLWEKHRRLFLYAYLGHIRKSWMVLGKTQASGIFDLMRSFQSYTGLKWWGNLYSTFMFRQIHLHRDVFASWLMYFWLFVCPAYGFEYFCLIIYRLFWTSSKQQWIEEK